MTREPDIVERLREYARNCGGPPEDYLTWHAADEIERLKVIAENVEALRRNLEDVSCRQQNDVAQLRAALQPFAKMYAAPGGDLDKAIQNARAALEPKP